MESKKNESDKNRTPDVRPEKIKPDGPKKCSGKKPTIALMFQNTLP